MLDDNCLFCKIIRGEVPSDKVYEDETMLVFKDIEPKAKVHMLAILKNHFKLLSDADMDEQKSAEVLYMLMKIPEVARANGCEKGFRIIANQGEDAGQSVFHLHFHIMGGETLPW
ncbi:MAG: histidine triad nucleotide-binding protein [Clostridia bacterium]|nr:histidine triad nucleotide-binding protein [Clostridia bacterium]